MRSVLLSLVVSVAAMAQQAPPPRQTLSVPGGRFVFGQVSDYRSDQYLLDTQTGRMWAVRTHEITLKDGSKDSYTALDPIPFAPNLDELFSYLPPAR